MRNSIRSFAPALTALLALAYATPALRAAEADDLKLLREQIRPSLGLTQPTGADGPVEPLARLVCRHREQFVKAMFLQ